MSYLGNFDEEENQYIFQSVGQFEEPLQQLVPA